MWQLCKGDNWCIFCWGKTFLLCFFFALKHALMTSLKVYTFICQCFCGLMPFSSSQESGNDENVIIIIFFLNMSLLNYLSFLCLLFCMHALCFIMFIYACTIFHNVYLCMHWYSFCIHNAGYYLWICLLLCFKFFRCCWIPGISGLLILTPRIWSLTCVLHRWTTLVVRIMLLLVSVSTVWLSG